MADYYILMSAVIANAIAQFAKPFSHYIFNKKWDWHKISESGGFPSSHSSSMVALVTSIGFVHGLDSTYFAIAGVVALLIMYDAANVRYYAGKNIETTRQIIKDIELLTQTKLSDPVYFEKFKIVLGHKWVEIFGGMVLGVLVSTILYYYI